jgi:hypothetical protein
LKKEWYLDTSKMQKRYVEKSFASIWDISKKIFLTVQTSYLYDTCFVSLNLFRI